MGKHRGPLTADLHQHHGVRLALGRRCGYSVLEIADFAANLPVDSAVARAVDPDWAVTTETLLLREIEHGIRISIWQQTPDGSKKHPQHYPQALPVTHAEIDAQKKAKPEYDRMTIAEADEFLGWTA